MTHISIILDFGIISRQDKSELSPYLKEMVILKVRLLFNGLPWNTEGYEQAKNILSSRFGKPSELANTHIQNNLSLLVIAGANPVRINEFYEKLMTGVQSLDTVGKLKEINGYVRITVDKLPGIRADLVRIVTGTIGTLGNLKNNCENGLKRTP